MIYKIFHFFSVIINFFTLFVLVIVVNVFGDEPHGDNSNNFNFPVSSLSRLVSDDEIHLLVNGWKTHSMGGQKPKKLSDIPVTPTESRKQFNHGRELIFEKEYEFIKFNLLRGLAQKISIVWYNEEGLESEITKYLQEEKNYVYDEKRRHSHEVLNSKDMRDWKIALSVEFFRHFYSSTSGGGIGYGANLPIPPHGIIFETDNEKVFIGITRFGFLLGSWKGNKIDQSKLFYSPELALFLDDYVKKNKLQNFPKINIDVLSGKNAIQSRIEGYQYRKQKENNIKNDDGE
jgi:hypothetical protein